MTTTRTKHRVQLLAVAVITATVTGAASPVTASQAATSLHCRKVSTTDLARSLWDGYQAGVNGAAPHFRPFTSLTPWQQQRWMEAALSAHQLLCQ